jgi:hypothetical protein
LLGVGGYDSNGPSRFGDINDIPIVVVVVVDIHSGCLLLSLVLSLVRREGILHFLFVFYI